MSAEIRKEVERLSIELEGLKKLSYSGLRKIPPKMKLKRYHALLNRISNCPEVDITLMNSFLLLSGRNTE